MRGIVGDMAFPRTATRPSRIWADVLPGLRTVARCAHLRERGPLTGAVAPAVDRSLRARPGTGWSPARSGGASAWLVPALCAVLTRRPSSFKMKPTTCHGKASSGPRRG